VECPFSRCRRLGSDRILAAQWCRWASSSCGAIAGGRRSLSSFLRLSTSLSRMRAGHPVSVAVSLVARELPDPIGNRIRLTADEMTYGLDLETALKNMCVRVGQQDLPFVVVAVSIQTKTGGNLAEVLSNLSRVIRDRFKLRRRVKAMSTEGRMSATALSLIPLFVFVMVNIWHRPSTVRSRMIRSSAGRNPHAAPWASASSPSIVSSTSSIDAHEWLPLDSVIALNEPMTRLILLLALIFGSVFLFSLAGCAACSRAPKSSGEPIGRIGRISLTCLHYSSARHCGHRAIGARR